MPQHHLVIANGVEATLVFFLNLVQGRVVIHYDNPGQVAVTPALGNTVFNSIGALWTANLAALCPTTVSFQRVDLRNLNVAGEPLVASTAAARPGTAAAADMLPPSIASCFTVRTSKAGRQFRGRMYFAGYAETANDAGGRMTTAAKTAFDTFATGFVAAANVGGLVFGVAHRPTAFDPNTGLPISPGLGFTTPATQVVCRDSIWDSQRRRNR